jgi:hypothetical protein
MLDDFDDAPGGDIRAASATVNYDGSITAMLTAPDYDEPVAHTFKGNDHTLLMSWGSPTPVDLEGTTAADRRCQAIAARGVARLNEDLARRRAFEARRRREHLEQEDEIHVGCMG